MGGLKIFSGRSNEPLARAIVDYIFQRSIACGMPPVAIGLLDERRQFTDGEMYTRFAENIRGSDVFLIQSTNQPDTHLLELYNLIKTARMASADRITAVIPYYGYARQDRKDKPRAPVTTAFIARDLWACGVDRVLLLDVHSDVTLGAFASLLVPTDHLWARPVFLRYLQEHHHDDIITSPRGLVIVAPDVNAGKLAKKYAEVLGTRWIILEKWRPRPGESEVLHIIGDVSGEDVLIVDDMSDTAGTLCNAASVLKQQGAGNIYALATHGLFSGNALQRIKKSSLTRVFVTDSILHKSLSEKIEVISVAKLLGEAIWRIHRNESVSSLFE